MKSALVGSTRIFGTVGVSVLVLVLLCVNDSLARTGPASRNSVDVGSGCRLNSGRRGQCKIITDCPSAVAQVRNAALNGHTIALQRCGFEGTTEIVCCESSSGGGGNGQGSGSTEGVVRPVPGLGNLVHRKPWHYGAGGTPNRDSEWLPSVNRNTNGGGRNVGRASQPQQERKSVAACRAYTSECPAKASPHIVGGTVAALGEFPHMAALGYNVNENNEIITRWDCGGTLISKRYVLTAAHCSTISNRKPFVVRLGESDFLRDDDGATPIDIPIESVVTHPDYVSATRYNDIALVRMQREVQLSEFICPACLYTGPAPERSSRLTSRILEADGDESRSNLGNDYDYSLTSRILPDGEEVGPRQNDIEDLRNTDLLVTGWGDTEYRGDRSSVLLKAAIQAVTVDDCNSALQRSVGRSISLMPRGVVQNVQLCAGDLSGNKDTCQGDSGGPLQFKNTDSVAMYTIVGVTSFGSNCGISVPAVYTRVSSYIDWIENIVWPQAPPF